MNKMSGSSSKSGRKLKFNKEYASSNKFAGNKDNQIFTEENENEQKIIEELKQKDNSDYYIFNIIKYVSLGKGKDFCLR